MIDVVRAGIKIEEMRLCPPTIFAGDDGSDSNFKQPLCPKTQLRDLAAQFARVLPGTSRPPFRGRRECRAPDAPDSRVCNECGRAHTRSSGHTGITRHSPRNGLRLISCSPRRPGFLATVAPEKLASQELDASVGASGPHVFAVRLHAVRYRRIRVHRIPHQRP